MFAKLYKGRTDTKLGEVSLRPKVNYETEQMAHIHIYSCQGTDA